MKRARFTEEQIIGVLKEHEAGAKTSDLGRKHGASGHFNLTTGERNIVLTAVKAASRRGHIERTEIGPPKAQLVGDVQGRSTN